MNAVLLSRGAAFIPLHRTDAESARFFLPTSNIERRSGVNAAPLPLWPIALRLRG
jgi:hypothetical protein